jgi:threonine/homoserine/homoserine lactone efflux protein
MDGTHDFGLFLLASFLVWITPGPDIMYISARSISRGRGAGVMSALGSGTGCVIHTAFAAVGLSAILVPSSEVFFMVQCAGALYLIYLGVRAFRTRALLTDCGKRPADGYWQIYGQGVVTNVLNPKVAVFFVAFLPLFVDPRMGPGPLPFLFLGFVFGVGGTLWNLAVAIVAETMTRVMRRDVGMIGRLEPVAGCVYIGLGLCLLLRSRPALR